MSILKTEIGTAIPNFLDSEVGLVTKTAQIPQSMGQTDGDRKTVFAGTVFPANTSAATGIVFEPWHWRYVGVENALAIRASGLSLEEFIALQRAD